MYYFRTLGSASLRGPHGTLTGRVVQPRRLALLALLATADNAARSRDKLIAYLWPETKTRQARHHLSDSLYVLHRALGDDAILASGDEIRLNQEIIRVDVIELRQALNNEDLHKAVACYQGPFLDGFHVSGVPDLERWIEGERETYSKSYAKVLESLAEQSDHAGDRAAAIDWWRQLAQHEPFSSHVVVRLVNSLLAAGDRAEALLSAQNHIAFLRTELDLEPPQELLDLAEEIEGTNSRQPHRSPTPAPSFDKSSTQTRARLDRVPPPTAPESRLTPVWRFTLGLAFFAVALATVSHFRDPALFNSGPRAKSIAVLPLVNLSDDPGSEYFSDGITGEIITALSKVADLEVRSRTSSMAFKGTREPVRDVGRKLAVAAVLEGELQRGGEFFRVNVRLINTQSDRLLWARQYNRMLGEVFTIQTSIAQEIAKAMSASMTSAERRIIERQPTENLDAYDYYLQGHEYFLRTFDERDLLIAQQQYQKAVDLDPTFALAHARLSETHSYIYWFHYDHSHERAVAAKAAAQRAQELAPDAPEVNRAIAYHLYHCELDYDGALVHFSLSLRAQPNDAHTWMGIAAVRRRQGDFRAATDAFERAIQLDPLSAVLAENIAVT